MEGEANQQQMEEEGVNPQQMEDEEQYIILSDDDSQNGKEEEEQKVQGEEAEDDNQLKEQVDEESAEPVATVEAGFYLDDLEMLELTLPAQNLIKDLAVKLWKSRKLVAYPLPVEVLQESILNDLLSDDYCDQLTIHLDRESSSRKWIGILDFVLNSKSKQQDLTNQLKEISSDIKVLNMAEVSDWSKDFDASRSAYFSSFETKDWPSCVVCVKYLPQSITDDRLREIFPNAFDVLIYTNAARPNLTEAQRRTGFLFYGSSQEADEAVTSHNKMRTSVDGTHLAFFKYDRIVHPPQISLSFMKSTERYVILKEKQTIEQSTDIPVAQRTATVEKFNLKIKEDDVIRKTYGFPAPTLEELSGMKNLRAVDDDEASRIIKARALPWQSRVKVPQGPKPEAVKPPAQPANKGLPNKRKRQKSTLDAKTTPGLRQPHFAGRFPSLVHGRMEGPMRQPRLKLMRFTVESNYLTYENSEMSQPDVGLYADAAYQHGPVVSYAVPPRRPPAPFARPALIHPGARPRISVAHALMPRSAIGKPRLVQDSQLGNRLLSLAHSGAGNSAAPRPQLARIRSPALQGAPRVPAFRSAPVAPVAFRGAPGAPVAFGGAPGAPVAFRGRPAAPGFRSPAVGLVRRAAPLGFPGAGMSMHQGVVPVRARPGGRAGWAVHS